MTWNGEVLPTHSWYVGYAPYDDPEIVVVAFMYYGGEGSQWAAPIVRDVIAAYYEVAEYAPEESIDPFEDAPPIPDVIPADSP